MSANAVHELWRSTDCLGAAVDFGGATPLRLLIEDPARDAHERLLRQWEQTHPKANDELRRRVVTLWAHLAAPGLRVLSDGYRASEWARTAWSNAADDADLARALAFMRIQVYAVRDAGARPSLAPHIFSLTPADLAAATRQGTLSWTPAWGIARASWCRMPEGLVLLMVVPWESGAVLCSVVGAEFKTAVRGEIGRLGELVAPADTIAALAAKGEWKAPEADWGARLDQMPKAKYGDLVAIAPGGLYLLEMGRFEGMGSVETSWAVIHIPSGKRVHDAKHISDAKGARGVKSVAFAGDSEIERTHEDGQTERVALKTP